MKLEDYGASFRVLFVKDVQILFSYKTPVAGYTPKLGFFRTKEHFSATTTKHINSYLSGINKVTELDQHEIETLLD